jgi:hypothetical protein
MFTRTAGLLAALVLTLAAVSMAEAQANQTFRFTVSFQTDISNYLQTDEYLDPIRTMFQLNCPPVFGGTSSPLCDPAFTGFYRDLYSVGVIDGLEIALAFFNKSIMRCGDKIAAISDATAAKIAAIDPRLRGSQGAAALVAQSALEAGCTIDPLP